MTKVKIGINGFGRIGRIMFRAAMKRNDVDIVAINDLLEVQHLAYMLKYDSVHGNFDGTVEVENNQLVVNGKAIRITAERNPENINWGALDIDVVAECTGIFYNIRKSRSPFKGRRKEGSYFSSFS